jgi:hypothetical protein
LDKIPVCLQGYFTEYHDQQYESLYERGVKPTGTAYMKPGVFHPVKTGVENRPL